MKIKLADGTEVEVADDSSVAIAARELEKAKGLGFDSIEAWQNSLQEKVAKLENQTKADQEFIDRQKNELGELRKVTKPTEEKPTEKEKTVEEKQAETAEEREARYAEMNSSVHDNLTEDQMKHAEEEFKKQYAESTPQERALLKSEEGRNAFLGLVFPEEETSGNPVSLFTPKSQPSLSIGEQVKLALSKDPSGTSRQPAMHRGSGSGYNADRKPPEHKKVQMVPLRSSGGVLDAMKQLESKTQ